MLDKLNEVEVISRTHVSTLFTRGAFGYGNFLGMSDGG